MGLLSSQTCGRQGDGEESGQSQVVNCAECRYGIVWDELQCRLISSSSELHELECELVPQSVVGVNHLCLTFKVGVLISGRQETHV